MNSLVGLDAELDTVGQAGLTTGRVAHNGAASGASDDGLGVAEDDHDGDTAGALDVHEVGVGSLDQALLLVLGQLGSDRRVQKVLDELHRN